MLDSLTRFDEFKRSSVGGLLISLTAPMPARAISAWKKEWVRKGLGKE